MTAWGIAVALLAPATARGDGEEDAKQLFARARELRAANRCVDALPLFRHAFELYPAGLGSERNIAECEEQLGHFAAARRAWSELASALASDHEPRYAGWSHDAEDAVKRLAARVGTLTVDVGSGADTPGSKPLGAVTVNGALLPPAAWGTPVDLDPGHYVVRYEGEAQEVQAVDLAAGESRRVALHAGVPAAVAILAPASGTAHDPRQPLRIGGWVAMGLGLASFVGLGITGIVWEDAHNTEQSQGSYNDAYWAAHSRGKTAATLANVFIGVGSAGVATGVVLFALGHGISPKSEVALTPGGVALHGRF